MEHMVALWRKNLRTNYTFGDWNRSFTMCKFEFMFLSDYFCLVLQYDWSSGSFAVTWFFLGFFRVSWCYGSLEHNSKLMALSRNWDPYGDKGYFSYFSASTDSDAVKLWWLWEVRGLDKIGYH